MASTSAVTSGPKQSGAWLTFLPSSCGQPFRGRSHGVFRLFLPLGAAQMGGKHQFRPLLQGVFDGRNRAGDAGVFGDVAFFVLGDIEVNPDEDLFPLEDRARRYSG